MRLVLLFIWLIFSTSPVLSQSRNLVFKHIDSDDGLSQNYITCLFHDSKGYMWIGTAEEGLNKYDGYKFTIYRNSNDVENSLSSNLIKSIIEDSEGNLWIATRNGLNKFDPNTEKFYRYSHNPDDPNSLSENSINTILIDNNDNLWVGTESKGLNLFNKKNATFRRFLPKESITSIFQDSQDEIWIGTGTNGLYQYNKKNDGFEHFKPQSKSQNSLSSKNISAIFEDSRHQLWLASRDGGINLFNRNTNSLRTFKKEEHNNNSLPINRILALSEDLDGNIWIGTENGGLSIYNYNADSFTNFSFDPCNSNGINSNSIYAITKDTKGNMWLGTSRGGVNFFHWQGNKFSHYRQLDSNNSLNNNMIYGIFEDSKGNLLIGTDGGGLNIYDRRSGMFNYIMHEDGNEKSICGNHVLSVIEDSENNIWVGTWGNGVTMFNREKNIYKHFKNNPGDNNSLSGNNAWTLFEDNDKDIWIGTYWGGLSLYNRKTGNFTQYRLDDSKKGSFKSKNVNRIIQDKKGDIWIGTFEGLARLDKATGNFEYYVNDPENNSSISSNIITDILEDSIGNFWIGTFNGINYFERNSNQFTAYGKDDGLLNDVIKSVVQDNKGNLWISANGGISNFNVKTKSIVNYTLADGLQLSQFTQNGLKTKDGTIYFSGIDGFFAVHPDDIAKEKYDPQVVFTDFQIFNESVRISDDSNRNSPLKKHISATDEIMLSHKESVISFEFAALDYGAQEKKEYAYFLEGFDKKWNNIGNKRSATYTNLAPGNYTLKVRALNNEGAWSNKIASLKISIAPPFWETWWFRSVLIVCFIGGVITWYRVKVGSIKKQKKVLESEVEARTAQVLLQSMKIEELYKDIKDSIRAAEAIQESILPSQETIKEYLPEFFAFYKPKDIVSGDFYWFTIVEEKIIIAAVDCTGHGVGGALMAINGHYLLKQTINSMEILQASQILQGLNEGIISELNQEKRELYEGMDISLCIIDKDKSKAQFAGANSPIFIYREGKIIEIKGNKYPVGGIIENKNKEFTNHEIELKENDMIYLFSDGYADQIGGPDGNEKFMYFRLRNLITEIADKKMEDQLLAFEKNLLEWRNELDQLDDVMVLGFRV